MLFIVASVPITPTFLNLVQDTAAFAPGSITPITGIEVVFCIDSRLTADAVLQATTSILIFFEKRNLAFSKEYLVTVSGDLIP